MDAAFVLTVDTRGGVAQAESNPNEEILGFSPGGSAHWSNSAGRLQLACWSGPRRSIESTISPSESGASFVVGDVRMVGESWPDHRQWPERIAAAARATGAEQMQNRLRGVFAVGSLTDAGAGWVITDPLGLRCLYYGENEHRFVVASRAALVAHALASDANPPKDLDASTWLAYTSYWVGTATGYQGVSTAPPGAILRIEPSACRWQRNPILDPTSIQPGDSTVQELVPGLVEDIADSLRGVLARPAERHIIQLTGGKDSRVILGVAIAAGLADQFTYMTSGPDEFLDVQIAKELAETFGLTHETRFLGTRRPGGYEENCRRWISDVAGMVSGWETPGTTAADEILVSGVCGEFMRYFQRIPPGPEAGLDGRRLISRLRPGRLGLLHEPIGERRHQELLDEVRPVEQMAGDPFHELHHFYARNRMRFTRLGPRQEVSPEERSLPLYSPVAIRAALAMPNRERQSDLLFLGIMQACEPRLVTHRLAPPGWNDQARQVAGIDPEATSHTQATSATPEPAHRPKRPSLNAELQGVASGGRTHLMNDVLSESQNPIWELLDRSAARAAADRWQDLDIIGRREVFGAISAAIWADS